MQEIRTPALSLVVSLAAMLLSAAEVLCAPASAEKLPENLATKAKVSASSQFSSAYRPQLAVSGRIPSGSGQAGGDWAVRGTQAGWFELRWAKPVEVAQIVYCARMDSPLLECFKDYAVYLNGEKKPAVSGSLQRRHGPQMIAVPRQKATKVRIEFLSSHPNSPNPGAAEIAVFASPLTKAQHAAMRTPPAERSPESVALRKDLIEGRLGFSEILLVKRKPLNTSHVYVYHVEGYRPGGGLYVFRPDEKGGELR